jgi:hypothetical protein
MGSRKWLSPLLWILFIPFITVPLTLAITSMIIGTGACVPLDQGIDYEILSCNAASILLALAPGLLNLGTLLWLRSGSSKTRLAAIVATILGGLRLLVPVVGAFTQASPDFVPRPPPGLRGYVLNAYLNSPAPDNSAGYVTVVGIGLWLATFIAIALLRGIFRSHKWPSD